MMKTIDPKNAVITDLLCEKMRKKSIIEGLILKIEELIDILKIEQYCKIITS